MQSTQVNPNRACVIFDLGETVFDKPYKLSVVKNVIDEFGISLLSPFKAYHVWTSITASKGEAKRLTEHENNPTTWEQVFATTYARPVLGCSADQFYTKAAQVVTKSANPFPGMLELIEELYNKGYLLAILSNSDPISAKAIRESEFFQKNFKVICLSNETGFSKPSQKAFEDVLTKVDRIATECIFFDDRKKNVAVALELGFNAHQFENPTQVRDLLTNNYNLLSPSEDPSRNPVPLELEESYV